MGRLAFWKEGDTDGDEGVVVGGDEAIEHGTAEALDSRGGACEPGFGDADDSTVATLGWNWWRKCEGTERREERGGGTCAVRGTNDAIESGKGGDIGSKSRVDSAGFRIIDTWFMRESAV